MPTKLVMIQGIMTWDDSPTTPNPNPGVPTHPIMLPGMPGWGDPHPAHPIVIPPQSPPGTWGGAGQPFPTPPIHIPPNQGAHPEHPIVIPPGIWGPPGPWPTPPISGIPGLPGYEPPKPQFPEGGVPIPPAAGVPIEGSIIFVPGQGWVFVPKPPTQEVPPETTPE